MELPVVRVHSWRMILRHRQPRRRHQALESRRLAVLDLVDRGPGRINLQGEGFCGSLVEVTPMSSPQDEVFALEFRFEGQYPISPPSVTFVINDTYQAPVHPVSHELAYVPRDVAEACHHDQHVYSNGHVRITGAHERRLELTDYTRRFVPRSWQMIGLQFLQ